MTIRRRRFLLMLGAMGAAWPAKAAPAGFQPLFDGKTLQGWHKPPRKMRHGTGGHWMVEEGGVLAGEQDPPGSGNGGIFLTDEKFGDFELELEMNPDRGPDTGVFFRCTDAGDGFQMYVRQFNGETCPLPDYNKEKVAEVLGREGSIGLQIHKGAKMWPPGTKCRWRNLRIKRL